MKKYFYILAMVALGITACNKSQTPDNSKTEESMTETVTAYHFSIPAYMGEEGSTKAVCFDNSGATPASTSTFSTTEKVYVYNKTKNSMLTGYLTPTNLSNDDKNCDLTGDLTGTIEVGNELWLLYNADSWGAFYYSDQNGKESGVTDGAKAVVTVSATDPALTTSDAHFANLQSMFRFKFEDENSTPINVSMLTIYTTNPAMAVDYYGTYSTAEYNIGNMIVSPSPATSDYLYAGICFNPSHQIDGNKMVFLASDGTYLYRGKKAEPAAGFANGKYYYNTAPIQLTNEGALQTPDITWITPGSPVEPDKTYCYRVIEENSEISLTGTSFGYDFNFGGINDNGTTVRLNNLTATRFDDYFIVSYDWPTTITLDLTGTNSIACDDADCCVFSLDNLKLQGNGTLTVTSKEAEYCGLFGTNYDDSNNGNATTTVLDVSAQLAASGYIVTRSARTDNPDGTYTWTYTVYPASVTLSTMYSTDANSVKYYAARDGQTLTGNFGGYRGYITIADGATVTLNIGIFEAPHESDHAPIHCLGDANIILASGMEAYVYAGHNSNYPAVFVPEGKTLTISGTGELTAIASYSRAAGIGGGQNITGGNIVIAGGVISAYSGNNCAAIGSSSYSNCGNITISGGVIKEAKYEGTGNSFGAGIGSGAFGSCGTITISGGQIGGDIGGYIYKGASAIAGQDAASIGRGRGGSCGTITIGAGITFVVVSGASGSNNRIGGYGTNPCDVYFGNLKVYDKTARSWYNSSTGAYDASSLVNNNTYGGLKFEVFGTYWVLTPVTP